MASQNFCVGLGRENMLVQNKMEKNHINSETTGEIATIQHYSHKRDHPEGTQTPFKSIQWVNGAWMITPWPDVPPLPE